MRSGLGLDGAATRQVEAVVALVSGVLGDAAAAVYLFGSAVRGGLRQDSDLDLLVVTGRPLAADERRALVVGLLALSRSSHGPPDARHLEVTVVAHADVRPWRYPPPLELQYGDWWRREYTSDPGASPWTSPNADLAVVLTTVLADGVPLLGSPPGDLLDPVPRADLDRAVRDVIPDLLVDLEDDTRNILLTLARIWLTLETGRIEPKDVAAAWALERLPGERSAALRRARAAYRGEVDDRWDGPEARAAARDAADAILAEIGGAG